jgi:hypothetical protein
MPMLRTLVRSVSTSFCATEVISFACVVALSAFGVSAAGR